MISLRLPVDLEEKISISARTGRLTKTELIKRAIIRFFDQEKGRRSPYELGKDLFGKAETGKGNLSRDYKKLLNKEIGAKYAH